MIIFILTIRFKNKWPSASFKLAAFSLLGGEARHAGDSDDGLHRNIARVPRFLSGLLLQAVLLPPDLQRDGVFPDSLRSDRLALPVRPYHPVLEEQPVFNPDTPGDLGNGLLPVTSLHPEDAAAVNG